MFFQGESAEARRQKHPFLSPPATLNPDGKLNALVQDTVGGTTWLRCRTASALAA